MEGAVGAAPRGHYLADEAGVLAGLSGERLGQWARRGYVRSSQPGRNPRVYSYQDVAEAMVVHELREKRVPLPMVGRIVDALRERYGDWPLQSARLETVSAEGVPIASVLLREGDERFDVGRHSWQRVQDETVDPQAVVAQLERGGWAVRTMPDLEHVQVHPDRLSGRPTIRGRRVPARFVAELARAPGGLAVLQEDYALDSAQIRDAERWWSVAGGAAAART